MTTVNICGGVQEWGRGIFACPFCMERRRGLLALVFDGYGSNAICGGCGSRFYDGEGRFESDVPRADDAIGFVRARWKSARNWCVISHEVLSAGEKEKL